MRFSPRLALVALAAALTLALPAGASAATLNISGGVYTYTPGFNIANNLSVTAYSFQFSLGDQANDPITVTGTTTGCTGSGTTSINGCSTVPTSVIINAGPSDTMNDIVTSSGDPSTVSITINGGDGDDKLEGAGTLNGGNGNDRVGSNGTSYQVIENGDAGNDTLLPQTNVSILHGGTGTDTADLTGLGSVIVSLDGVANDGQAFNPTSNVGTDVENVKT